jgi:hypothetical protein
MIRPLEEWSASAWWWDRQLRHSPKAPEVIDSFTRACRNSPPNRNACPLQ